MAQALGIAQASIMAASAGIKSMAKIWRVNHQNGAAIEKRWNKRRRQHGINLQR